MLIAESLGVVRNQPGENYLCHLPHAGGQTCRSGSMKPAAIVNTNSSRRTAPLSFCFGFRE